MKVNSLIRNYVEWNIILMDRAIIMSTDDGAGKNSVCRKVKSAFLVKVYSIMRNNFCILCDRRDPMQSIGHHWPGSLPRE